MGAVPLGARATGARLPLQTCARDPARDSTRCCRRSRGTIPFPLRAHRTACGRRCADPTTREHCRCRTPPSKASCAVLVVGIAGVAPMKPDRHAPKLEILAQAVHQITDVSLREMIELIAEERNRWRPGLDLRRITDLDPPARGGGR